MKYRLTLTLYFYSCVFATVVWARQELPATPVPLSDRYAESGTFFHEFFGPDDYDGHAQTWSVVQDNRGVIYVGNNHRVLQYDGVSWRHIPLPNESIARALAVDADGTVYVGAQGDIGYLAPDSSGTPHFVSLREHVPPDARDFADVWRVRVLKDGVYFQSTHQIMRWTGDGFMRVWKTGSRYRPFSAVRDTLFVSEDGRGLLYLTSDSLTLAPGGEVFADKPVYSALPEPQGGLLLGTAGDGLFRRRSRRFVPFHTEADSLLTTGFLYNGVVLPGGLLSFGTIRKGGLVLDRAGRIRKRLTSESGVPHNPILGQFVDREGALWLAQDGGVTHLEINTPMTFFDASGGIRSTVWKIIRHNGTLYAATNKGLQRLVTRPGTNARFQRNPELVNQVWDLLSIGKDLIAGASRGVFVLREGHVRRISQLDQAYSLYRDPARPDRIYAGFREGLAVIRRVDGRWIDEGRIAGVKDEIRSIVRTDANTLWLATSVKGLRELHFTDGSGQAPTIYSYDTRDGLPEGRLVFMHIAGSWRLATLKGLFDFTSESLKDGGRRLVLSPDTTISAALEEPVQDFFRYAPDQEGNVWLRLSGKSGLMLKKQDGQYEWIWDRTPLARISQSTFAFLSEADGVVWIGRGADLIRYDTRRPFSADASSAVRVRRVQLTGVDSVLFGGFDTAHPGIPRLPYALHNIRFSYALPSFDTPEATQYRVRLDGFDAVWSKWTTETIKEYTNLSEGRYGFHVQARDVYGRLSTSKEFAFTVLPPWYRTGWAYLAYVLLALGFVFGSTRWQQRRHRARENDLERQVRERTTEVARQRDQLEAQAERLARLDRIKSRFFANVTHEFRTPLTLTIGPLEDLLDAGTLDAGDTEQIELSLRNARRLLRLISQILDVARLEAGGMQLFVREGDLRAYASELIQTFTPLAERRHIALDFEATRGSMPVWFDADQIEKVFGNLLSNALKFTPEGGTVRLTMMDDGEIVVVKVSDTGPGIPPEDLAHLFDRFYQTGESASHVQPGTGIGLALVKEIVGLHGGAISVESTVGEGTSFVVRLPRGSAHFTPDQLAADDEIDTGTEADERLVRYADLPAGKPATREEGKRDGQGDDTAPPDDDEARADAADVPLVLVVDDNAELRGFVRRHLEPAYRVVDAEDGTAALALARAAIPDLIVSDVMMPGMDGDALCRAVKTDPDIDFIPVILLTARASMEGKLTGLAEGADDYLTKPFDMRELVTRVDNLIALRRRLKARWQGNGLRIDLAVPDVTSADEAFLSRVCEAIEAGMADETFSVVRLADEVGQSRVNLHRKLKHLTEKTPSEWILSMRLERAAELLIGEVGTVSEVAYGVGFKSVSYFCKCFRIHYGSTPSAYRASK